MSIILYILLWLYLDLLFQEKMHVKTTFSGKRYESMFCSMYVVTSATTSSLTETILIAMLFPSCCQVSTNCKHLCFPTIPEFNELYNEKLRNGIHFCITSTDQDNKQLKH